MKKLLLAMCAVCVVAVLLIHYFPIYRYLETGVSTYYNKKEIGMLIYIGSPGDRKIGKCVVEMADAAFSDIHSTREANIDEYGLLARYATEEDRGAVSEKHDLDMLSAHFEDDSGYIWMRYSNSAYDADGNMICGNADILSLWYLEKDDSGEWKVIDIKEHP